MSEQQPCPPAAADAAVVVVVVVSERRVLIGRRADATPPWTLLGGKIEPGESAAGVEEHRNGGRRKALMVLVSRMRPGAAGMLGAGSADS